MPRPLRIILVTGLLAAGLLVLLEFGLRIFLPQGFHSRYLSGTTWSEPDSALGVVLAPGCDLDVRGPEFTFRFTVSRQGFRDRVEHAPGKHTGGPRILLVGDSFTLGAGNEYDAIWPVLFERRLQAVSPGADVVKAGVLGYDTRTELLYLERLLPVYEPDVVVLGFLPNDMFTNTPPEEPPPPPPGSSPAATLLRLQIAQLASRILLSVDRVYERIYLMTPRGDFFRTEWPAHAAHQAEVSRDLLGRVHTLCRSHGARLVVLSIPQEFQVIAEGRGDTWPGIDPGRIDAEFEAFAKSEGFAWIPTLPDLAAAYREGKDRLYYRVDGHLDAAGNRCVAEAFTRGFSERFPEMLPPSPAP